MDRLTWIPFWTLFVKEIRRFISVFGQTVVTPVISSSLYMLIFGVTLDLKMTGIFEGISYLSFLIPGILVMTVLGNASSNPTTSIAISKFHGELETLKMSPLSTSQIIWAMSLGGLVRGVVVGGIVLIIGLIFDYCLDGIFYVKYPFLIIYFLFVGGLTFAHLGVIIGFQARRYDHINIFDTFILVPLMFLGGVFFSLEGLHPFWKIVSGFNPVLYFINGMRFAFLGVSDISVGACVLVTALALIFVHLVAHFAVQKGSFSRW